MILYFLLILFDSIHDYIELDPSSATLESGAKAKAKPQAVAGGGGGGGASDADADLEARLNALRGGK